MIVDADDETRRAMAQYLRQAGLDAVEEADGIAAWIRASTERPAVIAIRRPEHVYGARLLLDSVRASVSMEGTRLLLVSPEEPPAELWPPDSAVPVRIVPHLSCESFFERIHELIEDTPSKAGHDASGAQLGPAASGNV